LRSWRRSLARPGEVPFNQRTDTGRLAYRNEWELIDERPCVVYTYPFWEPGEDVIWEKAVKACPLKEYGHMKLDEFLAEVAHLAVGMDRNKPAVKSMPGLGRAR
jgi:hypothetical protein